LIEGADLTGLFFRTSDMRKKAWKRSWSSTFSLSRYAVNLVSFVFNSLPPSHGACLERWPEKSEYSCRLGFVWGVD
jgi:hypothetical protein